MRALLSLLYCLHICDCALFALLCILATPSHLSADGLPRFDMFHPTINLLPSSAVTGCCLLSVIPPHKFFCPSPSHCLPPPAPSSATCFLCPPYHCGKWFVAFICPLSLAHYVLLRLLSSSFTTHHLPLQDSFCHHLPH